MQQKLKQRAIVRARELRARRTDTEGLLWWKLREFIRRGYHFRRQVPFRGYFLDFVEHGAKLVIEVDGSQHGFAERRAHDDIRNVVLHREGYFVLRFANAEVLKELERVVEVIQREIEWRRPHPIRSRGSTSPRGGGD